MLIAADLQRTPRHFPYAAYFDGQVTVHGIPPGITLKRPSSMSRAAMQEMLNAADSIFISGELFLDTSTGAMHRLLLHFQNIHFESSMDYNVFFRNIPFCGKAERKCKLPYFGKK